MVSSSERQQIEQRIQMKNTGLFTDDNETDINSIAIEKIIPSPYQPRRYFDPKAMSALVASVRKDGILQPILVRLNGDKYEIVAGERRYRAAKEAGLREIPVIIKSLTDEQAQEYALLENLQREDLNPIEETEGILQLLSMTLGLPITDIQSLINQQSNQKKSATYNVVRNPEIEKMEQVFTTLGRLSMESFRVHRLPLLKLPEDILDALRQGKIEYTKAKEIAKLKDEAQRAELLEKAIADNMSLSQIKKRLAGLKPQSDVAMPKTKIQQLSKRLNQQKLWETDKSKWKKIEGWLNKIETLLADNDVPEKDQKTNDSHTLLEPNSELLTEDNADI
jgi:ParB family chromosome partitioning protein